MPSPVGHALGALAAGWSTAPPPGTRRARWTQAAWLAALGIAPDLDLLIGRHSRETHSLGAAVIVASIAAIVRAPLAPARARIWLAACVAWASHPLLDAFGTDSSPPFGVMAFWPFSREHLTFAVDLFPSIYREWWKAGFLTHNLGAVAVELAVLAPVAGLVWWLRARRRAG